MEAAGCSSIDTRECTDARHWPAPRGPPAQFEREVGSRMRWRDESGEGGENKTRAFTEAIGSLRASGVALQLCTKSVVISESG